MFEGVSCIEVLGCIFGVDIGYEEEFFCVKVFVLGVVVSDFDYYFVVGRVGIFDNVEFDCGGFVVFFGWK